ncbi:MAG: hypothetical protein J5859_00835, partial [Clostridia bacterium]|nr:hypothetical protein [Clostridia bacterium]
MQGIWAATLNAIKKNRSYPGLFHLMEQYGDHASAEITGSDSEIFIRTYSEACDMAYSVCGNLQTTGNWEKGDVIGLIYDTCMDWPVLFWGILMAGGIPLLLNPGADTPLLVSIM